MKVTIFCKELWSPLSLNNIVQFTLRFQGTLLKLVSTIWKICFGKPVTLLPKAAANYCCSMSTPYSSIDCFENLDFFAWRAEKPKGFILAHCKLNTSSALFVTKVFWSSAEIFVLYIWSRSLERNIVKSWISVIKSWMSAYCVAWVEFAISFWCFSSFWWFYPNCCMHPQCKIWPDLAEIQTLMANVM